MTAVAKPEQSRAVTTREMRAEMIAKFRTRMVDAVGVRGADEYVNRQITLAMLKINESTELQKCSVESVATALIRLCGERLEVGATAHLVPMRGQCVYMRDWKGDVELMIRAGHVRDVKPYLVHANDYFRERVVGGVASLDWEAAPEPRGEIVRVFALIVLPHGLTSTETMSKAEVDAIRAKAPMPNSPGWRDHYGEMAKKTVVHRVAKRFPKGDPKGGAGWTPDDATGEDTTASGFAALTDGRGNDGNRRLAAPTDPYVEPDTPAPVATDTPPVSASASPAAGRPARRELSDAEALDLDAQREG